VATQYGISGTTAKGIAASVERAVAEGSLGPEAALPPVRRLADDLGVSPGTVAAAYKELRRRGIVITRGRGGTVVAPAPAVASRRPPKVPEGLRDLSGGHPDPALLPALVPPSRLSPGARSHRSAPRLARLEDAARDWMGADGVPVEHVTFAHGALDLIGRLLSVELRPGERCEQRDRVQLVFVHDASFSVRDRCRKRGQATDPPAARISSSARSPSPGSTSTGRTAVLSTVTPSPRRSASSAVCLTQ